MTQLPPPPAIDASPDASAGRPAFWREVSELWLLWLVVVLTVYAIGWAAWKTYGVADWAVVEGFPPTSVFGRWDVLNYVRIARDGYVDAPPDHVVWFPLLPLLMAMGGLAGLSPYWAGTAVALGSSFLLVPAFYRLAALDLSAEAARRATLLLLVFPSSFFLFIPYTEAPYLLLVSVAFLLGRARRWPAAVAVAALASGLRVTGVLLAPALLIEYGQSIGWRWRYVRADVLWLLAAPLGFLAYAGYLWVEFGEPLAFYRRQETYWERTVGPGPATHLIDDVRVLFGDADFETKVPLLAGALGVAVFVALLPAMLRYRMRASYLAFSLVAVIAPLSTGRLASMNRYVLAAFPIFLVLGRLSERYPAIQPPLVAVFAMLLSVSAMRFATYWWVG